MGRRSGFGSLLNAMANSAAQQQRLNNAQIRMQTALLKQQERDQKAYEKEVAKQNKEDAIQYGIDKSNEAEQQRTSLVSLLLNAPTTPILIDFNLLKRRDKFKTPEPPQPVLEKLPPEIDYDLLTPKAGFLDKLVKKRMEAKEALAKENYNRAVENRDRMLKDIQEKNNNLLKQHEKELQSWSTNRDKFLKELADHNEQIDKLKKDYINKDRNAIEFFFNQVLSKTDIPELLISEWEIEYNPDNRILIIDMVLPDKEIIPDLKSKKYIASRQEYTDTYLKDKDIEIIYDKMILQLCLRIVHDLVLSDIDGLLEMIVFNGIHHGINKSTGKEESKYIMSLNTRKDEFLDIDIRNVDARACFISLRGISGAKLTDLIPIAPSITMNKDDKRFVLGVDVAHTIEGQNLASMDWESFEHLIRELFEKEFATNGAEVRITQASRDGGVDAVMFDPDPIRGGKFIIQAKRYTNVVGVSAVRDLYGTLSHEGAVKGILVTTANFGADSYEFAKNKPLTLINGSNLLFLLQKHGYNARIDLEEAKRIQQSQ